MPTKKAPAKKAAAKSSADCCSTGSCCTGSRCYCRFFKYSVLLLTGILLLLVNLGVITGAFTLWLYKWWPLGVIVFALGGYCRCNKKCK